MRTLAIISARYESSRFPGKVLEKLMGKPILQWVIDYCRQVRYFTDIVVATDDARIENFVNSLYLNVRAIRINENVRCATERMWQVYNLFRGKYTFFVSIPADEPLVNYQEINRIFPKVINCNEQYDIFTLYTKFYGNEDLKSRLSCKVVTNFNDRAIYFSREIIPSTKDGKPIDLNKYKKHVGLFFFCDTYLERYGNYLWGNWNSSLSDIEGLEQNRFLEFGSKIKMIEIKHDYFGIDQPKQIDEATIRFHVINK